MKPWAWKYPQRQGKSGSGLYYRKNWKKKSRHGQTGYSLRLLIPKPLAWHSSPKRSLRIRMAAPWYWIWISEMRKEILPFFRVLSGNSAEKGKISFSWNRIRLPSSGKPGYGAFHSSQNVLHMFRLCFIQYRRQWCLRYCIYKSGHTASAIPYTLRTVSSADLTVRRLSWKTQ